MKNVLPGYKYDRLMNVLRTGNGSSQDMREIQDMKKRAELSDHYSYSHHIPSVNYVFINNESGFLHTGDLNYGSNNNTLTQNYMSQTFNNNVQKDINEFDMKDYDKKLLLDMDNEDSEYFISRMTYKKKHHLLTKDSFFYFGYNVDVDENTKYELDIKIKQQFKYDNYPIQMNIYGNYKKRLEGCEFNRPYDDRCVMFDSNDSNKVTVLLFCPNKVYNSVVTLDQLLLYKFEKRKSEVDLLTEKIFDNIDDDSIFEETFNSLNRIFSLTNLNIEKDVDRELALCLKQLSDKNCQV